MSNVAEVYNEFVLTLSSTMSKTRKASHEYTAFIYFIWKLSTLTNRSKHVTSTTSPTKGYIVYFFVMGYKLRLHMPSNQVHTSQYL
jgi:hypothetical protein